MLRLTIVKKQLDTGQLGPVAGITINLHVPQWPRAFQSSAGWLKGRTQGGYCREVFSHWIYLTRRLLGDGTLKHANTHFPTDSTLCETFVQAELDFGGVPVYLSGITGGAGPVGVEYTLWAEKKSFRLSSGGRFQSSDGSDWSDVPIPSQEKTARMPIEGLMPLCVRWKVIQGPCRTWSTALPYRNWWKVSCYHRIKALPQVNPPPNTGKQTKLPG